MKTVNRSDVLTFATVLFLTAFASPLLANDASEAQCGGTFRVSINDTPYKPHVTQPDTLWFQGKIELDSQLVNCMSGIVIKPSNGWQQVVSDLKVRSIRPSLTRKEKA